MCSTGVGLGSMSVVTSGTMLAVGLVPLVSGGIVLMSSRSGIRA